MPAGPGPKARGYRARSAATSAGDARPAARRLAGDVYDADRQHDQHQDRADLPVVVEADNGIKLLSDAAGADEADHGGAAHVDLEAQQQVAQEARQHLRQDRPAHALRPGAARGAHALRRLHVGVLHDLRELLAECADGVQPDGDDAGQRTDAHRPDQDQGIDDVRHRPERFQPAAAQDVGQPVRRQVGRRREAQRQRQHRPAQRGEGRHLAGLEQQPQPKVPPVEPIGDGPLGLGVQEQRPPAKVGDQLAEILADPRQPGGKAGRVGLGHPCRQGQGRQQDSGGRKAREQGGSAAALVFGLEGQGAHG
jgi:hypothetical protein